MSKYLINPGVTIGADPELFLVKKGKIRDRVVGSETIIKGDLVAKNGYGKVVTDGVQVELHPAASGSCRESFRDFLQSCLAQLNVEVIKHPGLKVSFGSMVTVSKKELMQLSDHAKFLGCKPSFNVYGKPPLCVNGLEYRKRSASGHIHIGSDHINNAAHPTAAIAPERLVYALDILVGIIGVLIDRDPKAVERRKLYGRAGEYRLPDHGLEYRTLSNFWLISYPVMSLIFGQAKLAFFMAATEMPGANMFNTWAYELGKDLLSEMIALADMKKVEKAINKNDFDLAYSVYEKAIKPTLKQLSNVDMGLSPNTSAGVAIYDDFEHMLKKSLKEWFPVDPMEHWVYGVGRSHGWENYARYVLRSDRLGQVYEQTRPAASIPAAVPPPFVPYATTNGTFTVSQTDTNSTGVEAK